MKVGIIGAGTMGSGIAQAFAHDRRIRSSAYVILMKNLLTNGKAKDRKRF